MAPQSWWESFFNLLPDSAREYGWAIVAVSAVVLLLLLWAIFDRLILRPLFGRRPAPVPGEEHLHVDVTRLPRTVHTAASSRRLLVEGVPARVRLVVLAPLGQGGRSTARRPDDALRPRASRVRRGACAATGHSLKFGRRGGQAGLRAEIPRAGLDPGRAGQRVAMGARRRDRCERVTAVLAHWAGARSGSQALPGRQTVRPDRWDVGLLRIRD